jgi:hypothetical protein
VSVAHLYAHLAWDDADVQVVKVSQPLSQASLSSQPVSTGEQVTLFPF